MQVTPRRQAGRSDLADNGGRVYDVADVHECFGQMALGRREVVIVPDDDAEAKGSGTADADDGARATGSHRRAACGTEVDALVKGLLACGRMLSASERRRDGTGSRTLQNAAAG